MNDSNKGNPDRPGIKWSIKDELKAEELDFWAWEDEKRRQLRESLAGRRGVRRASLRRSLKSQD